MPEQQIKWDQIYRNSDITAAPATVLRQNACLLPTQGTALDLACGLGGNALFLAQHGLETQAWDISPVALAKLDDKSQSAGLHIQTKPVKITPETFSHQAFDVIVVSRFLDRSLASAILDALNPDGLLFYQTFVVDKLTRSGPSNPDYLLQRNELLTLFEALTLVYYQELSRIGDLNAGNRDEALFIGQKT